MQQEIKQKNPVTIFLIVVKFLQVMVYMIDQLPLMLVVVEQEEQVALQLVVVPLLLLQ
jgi:hypothetical protein